MVITIFGNGVFSPSISTSVEEVLVWLDNLSYQRSRITKKNQFIERIAGIVLKRISRSKEFIPTENTLYS